STKYINLYSSIQNHGGFNVGWIRQLCCRNPPNINLYSSIQNHGGFNVGWIRQLCCRNPPNINLYSSIQNHGGFNVGWIRQLCCRNPPNINLYSSIQNHGGLRQRAPNPPYILLKKKGAALPWSLLTYRGKTKLESIRWHNLICTLCHRHCFTTIRGCCGRNK